MKLLFIALIATLSLDAQPLSHYGSDTSVTIYTFGEMRMTAFDGDSVTELHIDSISMIKYLLRELDRSVRVWMKTYKDMKDTIAYKDYLMQAAVDFSNGVPDIWKSERNCGWKRFDWFIKKEGYVTVKKTLQSKCKK